MAKRGKLKQATPWRSAKSNFAFAESIRDNAAGTASLSNTYTFACGPAGETSRVVNADLCFGHCAHRPAPFDFFAAHVVSAISQRAYRPGKSAHRHTETSRRHLDQSWLARLAMAVRPGGPQHVRVSRLLGALCGRAQREIPGAEL